MRGGAFAANTRYKSSIEAVNLAWLEVGGSATISVVYDPGKMSATGSKADWQGFPACRPPNALPPTALAALDGGGAADPAFGVAADGDAAKA